MPDVDRTVPVYPMGVVQKLTGLTPRQIRYYEKEGLLNPARTKGNRRLYAPDDVDRLLQIKKLLVQGLNIEGVRAWLQQHGDAELELPSGDEPTSEDLPQIDHTALIAAMRTGGRLSSLFPVNDQAELIRRLEATREAGDPQRPK